MNLSKENKAMLLSVGKRFLRAFVAGGVAQMAMLTVATGAISTAVDFRAWGFSLIVAFIFGGVMGLDKAFRFKK